MRAASGPLARPAREAFGQRHFIVQDASGGPIDGIQPIPPSEDFLRQVAAGAAAA